jgi:DNA mismatch repair ATPase MutL
VLAALAVLPWDPPRAVLALLDDPNHAMWARIHHDGARVTAVEGRTIRAPNSNCPGAPAALAGVDLTALLTDLGSQLADVERGSAVDDAFHDLLATMACHAAVRANQDVSAEEARALLDGLDAIDFKARCPHGRPVVFELSLADLERRVGRR